MIDSIARLSICCDFCSTEPLFVLIRWFVGDSAAQRCQTYVSQLSGNGEAEPQIEIRKKKWQNSEKSERETCKIHGNKMTSTYVCVSEWDVIASACYSAERRSARHACEWAQCSSSSSNVCMYLCVRFCMCEIFYQKAKTMRKKIDTRTKLKIEIQILCLPNTQNFFRYLHMYLLFASTLYFFPYTTQFNYYFSFRYLFLFFAVALWMAVFVWVWTCLCVDMYWVYVCTYI